MDLYKTTRTSLLIFMLLMASSVEAAKLQQGEGDPHYTSVGFFDIHVCNWPDRPLFFLTVISTQLYDKLKKVSFYGPDGKHVDNVQLEKYFVGNAAKLPEKRVYIQHTNVPEGAVDGWYTAKLEMKDGSVIDARDYVVLQKLPLVSKVYPENNAEEVAVTSALSWDAVPGAKHYRVFVRDMWDDGKLVFKSDVISENKIQLPAGILKPGGLYNWRIHSRDTNEHALLGDFNHGSLTNEFTFTTADE